MFANLTFQVFGFEVHRASVYFPLYFIRHPLFQTREMHELAGPYSIKIKA